MRPAFGVVYPFPAGTETQGGTCEQALLQEKPQGQGLGYQVGVGWKGIKVRPGEGSSHGVSLEAGGKAPCYTAAASSPTPASGRRSGRRESGCRIFQAGFRRASWLPSCLGLNMKREMSSPRKER